MKKRKLVSFLAGIVFCVTLVFGAQVLAQEQIVIETHTSAGDMLETFKDFSSRFMKEHPEVKFNLHPMGTDTDLMMGLMAMCAAGEIPDLMMPHSITWNIVLGVNGYIQDLAPVYKEKGWLDFMNPLIHNVFSLGDRIYFSPIHGVSHAWLHYNKDMLNELGLTEPTSLDELYKVSDAMNASGKGAMVLGAVEAWPLVHLWSILLARTIPLERVEDLILSWRRPPTDIKMTDPDFVKSFALIREWAEREVFMEGVSGMTHAGARSTFLEGYAGMYASGTWDIPYLSEAAEFNYGVMEFPNFKPNIPKVMFDDAGGIWLGAGMGIAPEKSEVIYELMDFVMRPSEQARRVADGYMPVRTITREDIAEVGLELNPYTGKVLDRFNQSLEMQWPLSQAYDGYSLPDVMVAMRKAVVVALTGASSPEEAAAIVQKSLVNARESFLKLLGEKGINI